MDAQPNAGGATVGSTRVVTFVLDAGALVAIERGDVHLAALLKRERRAGRSPISHGGVIGQVWRSGSGPQARLARAVPSVDVRPLDAELGRRAGRLLGRDDSNDVIDAAVVLLAAHGDQILTSDPVDIARLAGTADLDVDIVHV